MGCGSSAAVVEDAQHLRPAGPEVALSSVEAFDNNAGLDMSVLNDSAQDAGSGIDWEWKAADKKEPVEAAAVPSGISTLPLVKIERIETNLELQDFEEAEFNVPMGKNDPVLESGKS